jgi:DNA replication protein DnaC
MNLSQYQRPETPCVTCGKPSGFMDPEFKMWRHKYCEVCRPAGEELDRIAREKRAAEAAAQFEFETVAKLKTEWATICPPLYRATDPARLNQTALAEVLGWQYGPKGLVIHGLTNAGKTRMMFQLLHRIHFTDRRSVVVFDAVGFSHECARRFGDHTGEGWIGELSKKAVVAFDDLGKCRFTDRVESELFGLLEKRCANMLPIIATTNFTGDAFAERLSADKGEPMVRRLREFCQSIPV